MPKKKAGQLRSGVNARGGAALNAEESLPHTMSAEYRDSVQGRYSAAELLPVREVNENSSPNSPGVTAAGAGAAAHKRKAGPGHTQGKSGRTCQPSREAFAS